MVVYLRELSKCSKKLVDIFTYIIFTYKFGLPFCYLLSWIKLTPVKECMPQNNPEKTQNTEQLFKIRDWEIFRSLSTKFFDRLISSYCWWLTVYCEVLYLIFYFSETKRKSLQMKCFVNETIVLVLVINETKL